MPHISLLYGVDNMETREKIASQIKLPDGLSFPADKITIIPTTRDPATWYHLAEIPL